MFTAYLEESEADAAHSVSSEERRGIPVGWTKLSPPASMLAEMKKRKGKTAELREKVKEVMDSLSKRIWGDDVMGMDQDALKEWRVAQAELSQRHPYADNYYCLYVFKYNVSALRNTINLNLSQDR